MHRSFWTGLAAILLAITCIAAGWLWMMPHLNSQGSSSEEDRSIFYLEEDVDPAFPTTPTSSPLMVRVSNTSTRFALHQPPLNYLLGVKGDPKLEAKDIAVRVPVLMYHHIRPLRPSFTAKDRLYTVTPEAFRAQMEALHQAGYVTITPRDLQAALEGRMLLPEKSVLLTFDDGYREHFTRVFPILKELGLKATYFIISQADTSPAHMTQAMIKEVDASGLVTIASHSRHHWFLARLSATERNAEIAGAKQDLEKMVKHPVLDFAYPFGSWSQAVADTTKNAGYELGFGIRLGSLHGESSRYQLRRIRVLDGEDLVPILDAFSKP